MRFATILPAAYQGRSPHIHVEVYPSLAKATSNQNKIATSQMAMSEEVANAVYGNTGYEESVPNLAQVTLASDMVFGDGYDLQLPAFSGSVSSGYSVRFTCAT